MEDLKRKVIANRLEHRISYLHIGRARVDVDDSGLIMTKVDGTAFQQVPVASIAVILLEPGSVVTHEAVKLAAFHKCLLIWVGEGGVRLYAAGYNDFSSSEKLIRQFRMYDDPAQRLVVVRRMFERRFQETCPHNKSVEQLRGMEGQRVKKRYKALSDTYGVAWNGRFYDQGDWQKADIINKVISVGTSCLYGVVEAAIITAGFSTAVGFLHAGRPLSFVYDIADLYKDELVLPLAFELTKANPIQAEMYIRHQLRDVFKRHKLLNRLIPDMEKILTPVEKEKRPHVAPAKSNKVTSSPKQKKGTDVPDFDF